MSRFLPYQDFDLPRRAMIGMLASEQPSEHFVPATLPFNLTISPLLLHTILESNHLVTIIQAYQYLNFPYLKPETAIMSGPPASNFKVADIVCTTSIDPQLMFFSLLDAYVR